MALNAEIKKNDNGETESLRVEFTNGTLKQLNELSNFLKKDGFPISDNETDKLKDVVRIGIAMLESLKERKNKTNTEGI